MSEYEALAKNVIKKSLRIKPKESVIVECWNHGLEPAKEFVYQVRASGAKPMFLFEDEETHWRSVETLPPSKLGQVSASEWSAVQEADAYVFLPGPADIARYRKNMARSQAATAYNSDWYKRAGKAGLRGARVLLGYVSPERAASYGFDYGAWRAMILDAGSADFAAVARRGRRAVAVLSEGKEARVTAPNGTDFRFALRGKSARADDGIVDADDSEEGEFMTNVPPGYAYVVPDETSGEGSVVADLPTPYLGAFERGIRLDFDDGKARWSAESGADLIQPLWDRAKGPKDRLGYVSVGLNPAARTGFLQDDLVDGVLEIGIGDNEEAGGRNKTGFYLGARLSGATLTVDNKVLVDSGRLVI